MVAEVGVHDDDEVAGDELQAVDVGRSETQLSSARLEDDVGGVGLDELVGDILGSVGRAVVDNDEFPIQVAAIVSSNIHIPCFPWPESLRIRQTTYLSVKVRFSNHATMGRFFLSLYVGRMTEYLSLVIFAGAMISSLR